MGYTVSEELVEILLNNDFIEHTEKDYPKHFEEMKKEGYISGKKKGLFHLEEK